MLNMRKMVVLAAIALVVPGLALAAGKPGSPGKSGSAGSNAGKVMFVLRGTLTAYTPAGGATDGSVSILVTSANHRGLALKGQTLTVPVSSATKVVGTFAANDNGLVKVRAPKNTAAAALVAALQAAKAWQVIDQGTSTSSTETETD
jgi:hypothetical protein